MTQPLSMQRVAKEYTGKWIAGDFQHTRIVASGPTFVEAKQAAEGAEEARPILA